MSGTFPALRYWQIRTHCCSWCFLWARKRAGHKMNVVFPCYANWETFVADTKCFWTKPETFFVSRTWNLCPQQMLPAGKRGNICVGHNVSATMCPRLLRRRANARNVSFRISLRWPIHIINPVDETKLSCYTSHRRSTTVSLETYPSIRLPGPLDTITRPC